MGIPGYCGAVALMFHALYLLSLDLSSFERWMDDILSYRKTYSNMISPETLAETVRKVMKYREKSMLLDEIEQQLVSQFDMYAIQKADRQVAMLIHIQAFSDWLVEGILKQFFADMEKGERSDVIMNRRRKYSELTTKLLTDSNMDENLDAYVTALHNEEVPERVLVRRFVSETRKVYAHVTKEYGEYNVVGPVIRFDYTNKTCEMKENETMDTVYEFLKASV